MTIQKIAFFSQATTMTNRPAPIKLPASMMTSIQVEQPEIAPEFAQEDTDYYNQHIKPIISRRQFIPGRTASEIVEGIWLGDASDAMDIDTLNKHGIDSVVNCAEKHTLTCAEFYPFGWNYLGLDCDDAVSYDILGKHMREFIAFMDKCVGEKKKVLVHCAAGINRSATLLIAYLVRRRGMCLKDAISLCFQKRPIILTNEAFVMALIERFV